MKLVALMLLIFALAPLPIAAAQGEFHIKILPTGRTVSDSLARTKCFDIPQPNPYVVSPLEHTCRVVSYDTLSRAGGKRWSYAVQRHVYVYDFSDSAHKNEIDTLPEVETILYSRAASARTLVPVLYAREGEEVVYSITPDIADRGSNTLLGMRLCLNGTGGCWQEFMRSDGRTWHSVADPVTELRSRVLQVFHGDTSHTASSPMIDVHTLHGTAGISGRHDPNCCPSDLAEFDLALDGNRFRIVRFKIVRSDH